MASRKGLWWSPEPPPRRDSAQQVLLWPRVILGAVALLIVLLLLLPLLSRVSTPSTGLQPSATTELPTATLAPVPTAPEAVTTGPGPTGEATAATAAAPSQVTATLLPEVMVAGILEEYRDRNPALFSSKPFGAYLWAEPELQTKLAAPIGTVVISNDDRLAIIGQELPDRYYVRVVSNKADNNDPRVVGAEGWLPRWLVDNQNVPLAPTVSPTSAHPTATPGEVRSFVAEPVQTYPSGPDSGQKSSCLRGRVTYKNGNGVPAAQLYINNGSPGNTGIIADGGGNFSICSMGYSNWSLVLNFVPRQKAPSQNALARQVVQTFFVDGGSSRTVIINFRER